MVSTRSSVALAFARARGITAPIARFSPTDSVGNTWRPSGHIVMPRRTMAWPYPLVKVPADVEKEVSRKLMAEFSFGIPRETSLQFVECAQVTRMQAAHIANQRAIDIKATEASRVSPKSVVDTATALPFAPIPYLATRLKCSPAYVVSVLSATPAHAAEMVGMRWNADGDLVEAVRPEWRIDTTTRNMIRDVIEGGLRIGRVALVNNLNSTLAQEKCELVIPLRCGPEVAVLAGQGFEPGPLRAVTDGAGAFGCSVHCGYGDDAKPNMAIPFKHKVVCNDPAESV